MATATVTHTIPDAKITVTGTGFPPYSPLTSLTFGGISALPLPAPVVDGKGTFTTTFALPLLPQATAVFAPLETRSILEVVTTFDYASGGVLAYVPNLPGNTLKQIQPNSALFVTVSQNITLSVSGKTFELKANVPTPVPMGALVSLIVLS